MNAPALALVTATISLALVLGVGVWRRNRGESVRRPQARVLAFGAASFVALLAVLALGPASTAFILPGAMLAMGAYLTLARDPRITGAPSMRVGGALLIVLGALGLLGGIARYVWGP